MLVLDKSGCVTASLTPTGKWTTPPGEGAYGSLVTPPSGSPPPSQLIFHPTPSGNAQPCTPANTGQSGSRGAGDTGTDNTGVASTGTGTPGNIAPTAVTAGGAAPIDNYGPATDRKSCVHNIYTTADRPDCGLAVAVFAAVKLAFARTQLLPARVSVVDPSSGHTATVSCSLTGDATYYGDEELLCGYSSYGPISGIIGDASLYVLTPRSQTAPGTTPPRAGNSAFGGHGVVSASGQIGPLQIGRSTVDDVTAFAGQPSYDGTPNFYQQTKSPAPLTLGYGCKGAGGTNCQTSYYFQSATGGPLEAFATASASFKTTNGVTPGMPIAQVSQLEGSQPSSGCYSGWSTRGSELLILEGSNDASGLMVESTIHPVGLVGSLC